MLDSPGAGDGFTADGNEAGPGTDAVAETGVKDAGAPDAARCNPAAPFQAPTFVGSLNVVPGVANARGARVTLDLRQVDFSWHGVLYTAARSDPTMPWIGAAPIANLGFSGGPDGGSQADQGYPTRSPNGLILYFGSNRTLDGGAPGLPTGIWYSTRTTPTSPWTAPQLAQQLEGLGLVVDPFVQGDGSYLYFCSPGMGPAAADGGIVGLGGYDIYRVPLATTGPNIGMPNGPIQHVTEISTNADDFSPTLTPDGKTVYFTRNALAGGGATVYRQIWTASRASATVPFGTPTAVAELADTNAESDPTWISADNCTLYFSSARALPNVQIYQATRGP
jgi:hypothetical protein